MKLPFAANLSLDTLSERDRRMLTIGGALVALLLLYVIFQLDSSVSSAHKRIKKKQDDLTWIQTAAPELAADGAMMSAPSGESLLVIVDRSARESGLGTALAGIFHSSWEGKIPGGSCTSRSSRRAASRSRTSGFGAGSRLSAAMAVG